MKNIRLAIFVVGTTVMLWLGSSTRTWDKHVNTNPGYSLVQTDDERVNDAPGDGVGTMDELDVR